mmetsp:Transcript_37080/g.56893  ORF Transcript_37080/g.56893 Transcript_37080/m.56893 type:complete len:112 (+) Transcript_37080:3010-3345(+)
MTAIVDPDNTIKIQADCDRWVERLTAKYQLHQVFRSIDRSIVELIVKKCTGNALICLQFFFNLIEGEFIELKNMKVGEDTAGKQVEVPTFVMRESLKKCIRLQNFTKIRVP